MDELQRQEEAMGRANREKKNLEELLKKTQEDLAGAEDKYNNLAKSKQKLKLTVDEVRTFTNIPAVLHSSPVHADTHRPRQLLYLFLLMIHVSGVAV